MEVRIQFVLTHGSVHLRRTFHHCSALCVPSHGEYYRGSERDTHVFYQHGQMWLHPAEPGRITEFPVYGDCQHLSFHDFSQKQISSPWCNRHHPSFHEILNLPSSHCVACIYRDFTLLKLNCYPLTLLLYARAGRC